MPPERDDWVLPDVSFMGNPDALKARADEAVRKAGRNAKLPERQEGVDKSGSIRVTVSKTGRVVNVEITDRWQEYLGAADFAKALFQAYVIAVRKVMSAKAVVRIIAERRSPPREERPYPVPQRAEDAPPDTAEEGERWLAAKGAELERLRRGSARLDALEAASHVSERKVSGPGGYLTIRVRGGNVIGIDGDAHRIQGVRVDVLLHEARSAFRAAQGAPTG